MIPDLQEPEPEPELALQLVPALMPGVTTTQLEHPSLTSDPMIASMRGGQALLVRVALVAGDPSKTRARALPKLPSVVAWHEIGEAIA